MNGIVNADRRPKPAMAAIKHAMRPVLTEAVDLPGGASCQRVTSWFDHSDARRRRDGRWAIHADGRPMAAGGFDVPALAP
jgi:hypothetical protein